MRALLTTIFLLVFSASAAEAHTRSQSQSRWSIEGDAVDVRVEAEAIDVTRLYALGSEEPMTDLFAREVADGLRLDAAGRACAPDGAPRHAAGAPGRIVVAWRFACPAGALAAGPVEIESKLFRRVAVSHLHFAALRDAEGRTAEAVLTAPRPRAVVPLYAVAAPVSFWGAFARFVPIGAEHVWSGVDHVAFMLALVLFTAGSIRGAIFAAGGFTLGHTATLALAALGVLAPDSRAVEALIGFTIAFVALEAGSGGGQRMRDWSPAIAVLLALAGAASLFGLVPLSPLVWFGVASFVYAYPRGFPRGATWIAMIFGLIHGCGFAGALAELDLPPQRLVASLFGFNLGVELGQIAVIGGALIVGYAARRAPAPFRHSAAALAGAALFALGGYWFVGRVIGI